MFNYGSITQNSISVLPQAEDALGLLSHLVLSVLNVNEVLYFHGTWATILWACFLLLIWCGTHQRPRNDQIILNGLVQGVWTFLFEKQQQQRFQIEYSSFRVSDGPGDEGLQNNKPSLISYCNQMLFCLSMHFSWRNKYSLKNSPYGVYFHSLILIKIM